MLDRPLAVLSSRLKCGISIIDSLSHLHQRLFNVNLGSRHACFSAQSVKLCSRSPTAHWAFRIQWASSAGNLIKYRDCLLSCYSGSVHDFSFSCRALFCSCFCRRAMAVGSCLSCSRVGDLHHTSRGTLWSGGLRILYRFEQMRTFSSRPLMAFIFCHYRISYKCLVQGLSLLYVHTGAKCSPVPIFQIFLVWMFLQQCKLEEKKHEITLFQFQFLPYPYVEIDLVCSHATCMGLAWVLHESLKIWIRKLELSVQSHCNRRAPNWHGAFKCKSVNAGKSPEQRLSLCTRNNKL